MYTCSVYFIRTLLVHVLFLQNLKDHFHRFRQAAIIIHVCTCTRTYTCTCIVTRKVCCL